MRVTPQHGALFALLALLGAGCELLGDTSLPDYANVEQISYVRHVQVLFEERCTACHNGSDAQLDLTSFDGMVAGSMHGGPVIPFDAGRSRLIRTLAAHPVELGESAVPQVEVDFLRRWIQEGARDDEGRIPYADREADILISIPGEALIAVLDPGAMAIARIIDLQELGFRADSAPADLAASEDGSAWFVALPGERSVLRFDSTLALTGLAEVDSPGSLALSRDAAWLVVGRPAGSTSGRLDMVETRDMRVRSVESVFPETRAAGVRPQGDVAFSVSRSADQVVAVSTAGGGPQYAGLSGPRHAVIKLLSVPGGAQMVALGSQSGDAVLLNVSNPESPAQTGVVSTGKALLDGVLAGADGLLLLDTGGGLWASGLTPGPASSLTQISGAIAVTEFQGHAFVAAFRESGFVDIVGAGSAVLRSIPLEGVPAAATTRFGSAQTR